jgi:hypothetical protein
LTPEEKVANFDSFISGPNFGGPAWQTIYLFNYNLLHMINLVELHFVLLDRMDNPDPNKRIDLSNLDPMRIVTLKQITYLDILSKIQSLIESTLIFVGSLSEGYKQVANDMSFYDFNKLNNIISKIKKKKCFNMRKALGFCDITQLGLEPEERKLMSKAYLLNCDYFYTIFIKLITFYEKYKIVYGKFKHGLNFVPNLKTHYNPNEKIQTYQFTNSVLEAFHRKSDNDSIDFTHLQRKDKNVYYNVISRLCFNDDLKKEIKEIMTILRQFVPYICNNHKNHGFNLGKSYLPYDLSNFDFFDIAFPVKASSSLEEDDQYKNIFKKICENMIRGNKGFEFIHAIQNEDMVEIDFNKPIINFLISN